MTAMSSSEKGHNFVKKGVVNEVDVVEELGRCEAGYLEVSSKLLNELKWCGIL